MRTFKELHGGKDKGKNKKKKNKEQDDEEDEYKKKREFLAGPKKTIK